jgi:hypothetical protein
MLGKLLKAAVAVTLSPVALVVDIVTLPASAEDYRKGPFDRTGALLKAAGENITDAVSEKWKS